MALPLLLGILGCDRGGPGLAEQLEPAGPCYEANLVDGLDTASTEELHLVFACLDQGGNLEPLAGLDAAMDAEGRRGDPLGVELAGWIEGAAASDLDPWALVGAALGWLADDRLPTGSLSRLAVEFVYGSPYDLVAQGGVTLASTAAMDAGAVRPLLPVAAALASRSLDGGGGGFAEACSGLTGGAWLPAAHTALAWLDSPDPTVAGAADALPAALAGLLLAAGDASNNRWSGPTGDSVRDLVDRLVLDQDAEGRVALERLAPAISGVLASHEVGDALGAALDALRRDGALAGLPAGLAHLLAVDAEGGPLEPGEASAFEALLDLVDRAHAPLSCDLDLLGLYQLEVPLVDDLAVALLEAVASWDPGRAADTTALLMDVLGWSTTRWVLDQVAASGACAPLDEELLALLPAIDRLLDAESGPAFEVSASILASFQAGGDSHVAELVELLAALHREDLVRPLEELLRDGAAEALLPAADLLPALLDPAGHAGWGSVPGGVELLDWSDAWSALDEAFADPGPGEAPLLAALGDIQFLLGEEAAWHAASVVAGLVADPATTTSGAHRLAADLLRIDPEGETLALLAPLCSDDLATRPLVILEAPEFVEALGASELLAEGPLPFFCRLVVDGTLEVVLGWLDRLLDLMAAAPETP